MVKTVCDCKITLFFLYMQINLHISFFFRNFAAGLEKHINIYTYFINNGKEKKSLHLW